MLFRINGSNDLEDAWILDTEGETRSLASMKAGMSRRCLVPLLNMYLILVSCENLSYFYTQRHIKI